MPNKNSQPKTQSKDFSLKSLILPVIITGIFGITVALINVFGPLLANPTPDKIIPNPSVVSVRPVESFPTVVDNTSAQSTATALSQNAKLVFSSQSKMELKHNKGGIVYALAGINLSDLIIEAKFYNPYNREVKEWSYGFSFRREGDATDNFDLFDIYIQSDSQWFLNRKQKQFEQDEVPTFIQQGVIKNLDISPNGANKVRVVVSGSIGYFYVNDDFISTLDISSMQKSGDVAIVTGLNPNQTLLGASTIIEGLKIWSLKP